MAFQTVPGDALLFFSPDGNKDSRDIPKFREYLDQGYDIVIASRMMRDAPRTTELRPGVYVFAGVVAVLSWLVIAHLAHYLGSFTEWTYFSEDSREYLALGCWLLRGGDPPLYALSVRPLGYPLLVAFVDGISNKGIVVLHLVAWLTTALMLLNILFSRMRNTWGALMGVLLFVTAVTPIILTFHALTETMTALLLVLCLWFMNRYDMQGGPSHAVGCLLSLSLLVLVKPFWHLYVLAVPFLWSAFRSRLYVLAVLTVVPVAFQFIFTYHHFRIVGPVFIDKITLNAYLLAKAEALEQGLDLGTATTGRRIQIEEPFPRGLREGDLRETSVIITRDLLDMARHNPIALLRSYWHSLNEPFRDGMNFGYLAKSGHSRALQVLTRAQAWIMTGLGAICSVLAITLCLTRTRTLGLREAMCQMRLALFAAVLFAYLVLITGLSFWQGDRLLSVSYVCSIVLLGGLFRSPYDRARNTLRC